MSPRVDTSVWSLAFRRDTAPAIAEVAALQHALEGADQVFATGLVLQEPLQGFNGPKARRPLIKRFVALGFPQQTAKTTAKLTRSATRVVAAASKLAPSTRFSSSSVLNMIWSGSARTKISGLPRSTSSSGCGAPNSGWLIRQSLGLRIELKKARFQV